MKVVPYLQFNGNCEEALKLYEKAFNTKAESCRYKDTPPSENYQPPAGTENFIMHADLNIGNQQLMFCDTTPDMPTSFGNGVAISISFDSIDAANVAFDVLKDGGTVGMEMQETFWSKWFGSLEDKFGVGWMITIVD